ncbi:Holliday junction resolvase RuvX [Microvirga sp. W0021]|uniref:Putative pre-16S rRNA nuclease n=1 Tax=Hohaiivirga grylli TaxID=3133970 RepID=A0ABV0BIX1_9HYPH
MLNAQDQALLELFGKLTKGNRLIGIDLGTKTIGLALSDIEYRIASPLETIKRVKFTPDAIKLKSLIEQFNVGGLVFGLPLNMDGSEGPRVQATRAFARQFKTILDIPVLFWDERMSTLAVTRTLLEADASRARRAELVDKMAASYILQGVLDRYQALQRKTAENDL